MEKGNKELDLFELINRGLRLFKDILAKGWNFFLLFIKFHFKTAFIIIPFLIIGVSLSIYQSMKENRKQYGEFMLKVNGSNSFVVSDIIKVLNQSVNPDTNNVVLAKLLNVQDISRVKKIYAINPSFVIDLNSNGTRDYVDYANAFVEDTLNSRMKNFLAVRIYSKGYIDFCDIQQRIVNYLIADPYLKNEAQERIKVAQGKIQALDVEIVALDSMRKQQMKDKNDLALELGKSSILLGKESSYYKEMMDLKDQKAKLQSDLDLQPNVVSIYSGVAISSEKSTIAIFLKDVGVLYAFGLFIAFIFRYRKRIKALLKD